MKVLHLPTSVGGNAWGLAQAEKQLGLDAKTLYLSDNWLRYPGDRILSPVDFAPVNLLYGAIEAFKIRKRYDILHFNFGASLIDWPRAGIHHWDLPLYRNSKLFVTFNGCDARQKFKRIEQAEICACKRPDCYGGVCSSAKVDLKKERRIRDFAGHGAGFFCLNPDLMNFLPPGTIFLPYTIANWNEITPRKPRAFSYPLRVLHAPSNRAAKGTDAVIDAVQRLQQKYPGRVELLLLERTEHAQALLLYEQADVVVDQLRIGWYGAFAVEAMKMGIPVIAYINPEDLRFIPQDMAKDCENAIIAANEFTLYSRLESLLEAPEYLIEKRNQALAYVHKWHDPLYVAGITRDAYNA